MTGMAMRVLSDILFALAALVGGSAILVYGFVTSLACGYAPGAGSCHAAPWELGGDDRFWLVELPGFLVASLIVLALLARRKGRA